ncbi:adenosylmethionine--8-amino-7-oxononanoate transaminase [bacterium]|nr:adenosylmethionine--8-amino-7-oxononanoate transaminase [bacterium]
MPNEKDLRALDRTHIWHPFTAMRAWQEEQFPVIARGEGSFLFDTEGRRYLDGVSSLWVTLHGHNHPHITRAIAEQAARISHSTLLGLSSEPVCALAERLIEVTPQGLSRVFFSDNGSTAVEIALKMAYQYRRLSPDPAERERTGFVSFRNAYHGDTLGAVSVGGMDLFHGAFRDLLFPVLFAEYPFYYRFGPPRSRESYLAHCLESLEDLVRDGAEYLGALIIEPLVQGAGGMVVAERGFLAGVRAICDRYGLLLITDEVATGFGRTGRMFACEHESVSPDLLCCAKGLTGGYLPMAATLVSEKIYERFLGAPGEPVTFFHGHSFTGNQLGAAAALASLEVFENERVLERMQPKIDLLRRTLQLEVATLEHVGEVRQMGFMVGIELVADRDTRQSWPSGLRLGHRVVLEARRRGLIIRPLGDIIVLMPHLSFSEDELLQTVQITAESIEAAIRGLRP